MSGEKLTSNKLTKRQRRDVWSMVIGGMSNQEIWDECEKREIPHVSAPNLSVYRGHERVKAAILRMDQEAEQVGLALRSRQIVMLAKHAQDVWDRMHPTWKHPTTGVEMEMADVFVKTGDFTMLARELRETFLTIQKLTTTTGSTQQTGVPIHTVSDVPMAGNVIGMLADAMELYLHELGLTVEAPTEDGVVMVEEVLVLPGGGTDDRW